MTVGVEVDPESLVKASEQIVTAVNAIQNIRLDAEVRPGHEGVAEALVGFCVTWQLATGLLARRSASAADALIAAAVTYADTDSYAACSMDDLQGAG